MSRHVGQVLVFLLGVSVTVGFYEGRRLVVNTSRALTVAQGQLTGHGAKRSPVREALIEQGGADALARVREERMQALGEHRPGAERGQKAGAAARAARERAQRVEQWKQMTPEEREAIRARRQARLAARMAGRAGADAPRAHPDAAEAEPPAAPVEAPDDALLDEEFSDTGLLLDDEAP